MVCWRFSQRLMKFMGSLRARAEAIRSRIQMKVLVTSRDGFEQMVSLAQCGIVNADPEPFLYDPAHFPPVAIKRAVEQLESARGRELDRKAVGVPGYAQMVEQKLQRKDRL